MSHTQPSSGGLSANPTSYLGPGGRQPPRQLGSYRLLERLGQGGMGVVYKALHVPLNRLVALKTLTLTHLDSPPALQRFRREMEALGRLNHPNVVKATDAGEADGCHYLAMEWVEGLDLGRLLKVVPRLAVPDACAAARQAAEALEYIHAHGLVHRDVKPSNLLLSWQGQVKLLDLGLALLRDGPWPQEPVTATGQVMGTADYIAPEQARESHDVDIRADLYSLGCTLFHLLAGQAPFAGRHTSFFAKIKAHIEEPPSPLREARPDVPAGLAALVERLLAKDPAQRPQRPAEVAEGLCPFTADADLPGLARHARSLLFLAQALGDEASPRGQGPATTPQPQQATATDQATSVQPAAVPGRRRWLPYAGLGGLAGVLLLPLLLLPSDRPPPPHPTSARRVGELLGRRPEVTVWADHRLAVKPPDWSHDPREKVLRVQTCPAKALFRLGETEARHYKLEVVIDQTPWSGGVGLFFGHRLVNTDQGPVQLFQTVELQPIPKLLGGRPCHVQRHGIAFFLVPDHRSDLTAQAAPLPIPRPGEHTLAVVIGPRGVAQVRWDDLPLPQITGPIRQHTFSHQQQGGFGICCRGASATFRQARFTLLEDAAHD